MKKTQLLLLALTLAAIGLGWAGYKWKYLGFPLTPNAEAEVWTIQARVAFKAKGRANKVVLQLPSRALADLPGFAVIEERFVSRDYAEVPIRHREGRQVEWTVRRDSGPTTLYYRATVIRNDRISADLSEPKLGPPPTLTEVQKVALDTLFESVRGASADTATFARAFVREFIGKSSDEAAVLLEGKTSLHERGRFIVEALALRKIPARLIQGFPLGASQPVVDLKPLLQVHNEREWVTIDLETGNEGLPDNFLIWTRAQRPLLTVESDPNPQLTFSIERNLADAVAIAERRTEVRDQHLIRYSLLSLPVDAQSVYRILLMVPIGAFIMLVLRNLIGVKTFGTFMPVLIALAFDQTKLLSGIVLFTVVVGMGLLVRFFMERLRLLLVPRLTAVLIVVVMLMALVSIMSNRLNIEVGLSVALFPMVIMAMTIERLSIAWDERGAGYAIKMGVGSLVVASLAYLVMSWEPLRHLVFVFPELLLVLFAATLLLGRYSGYRLTELFRFRALARERDAALAKRAAESGAST